MHELGIAFHIIKEVDSFAEGHSISSVKGVVIELGEVSGVVPSYLEDVWVWACKNRSKHLGGCKLKIIVIKATTYCSACSSTFPTLPNGKKCPHCGSEDTYLVEGNEVTIQSIQVEDEPSDKD
jgi:hydrogenase nickel incorporation protein HypA/HybF